MTTGNRPDAVSWEEYLRRLPNVPPQGPLEEEIFDRLLMQDAVEKANRLDTGEPKLVLPLLIPKKT